MGTYDAALWRGALPCPFLPSPAHPLLHLSDPSLREPLPVSSGGLVCVSRTPPHQRPTPAPLKEVRMQQSVLVGEEERRCGT